ncbi:hypothetical protein ACWXWU_03815 [Shewanella sp. A14]
MDDTHRICQPSPWFINVAAAKKQYDGLMEMNHHYSHLTDNAITQSMR